MSEQEDIKGFWSYLLFVVLKPWIGFWIAGFVMGVVYTLTWLRDNTFSEEMQRKYATQQFLPQWQWRTWVILSLILALCSVIRNGYKVWRHQKTITDNFLMGDFPKVAVSYSEHDDALIPSKDGTPLFANQIVVRNLSDKPVFNVSIADIHTPKGSGRFEPEVVDHISVNGTASFMPRIAGASPLFIHSLGHLLKQSYEDKGLQELFENKAFGVKVSYDDGNMKYLAECTLLYRHWKNVVRMGMIRYTRLKS